MNKFTDFIENRVAPPLIWLSETRYLKVIQATFMTLMSLLIFSSLLLLVAALPIPGWSNFVAPITTQLYSGVNSTLGLFAITVSIVCGYYLGEYYRNKGYNLTPITTSLLSFMGFTMFFPMFTAQGGKLVIDATNLGETGLFASIIISIIVVELYRLFIKWHLTIKMPEGIPPMVLEAFTALIPSTLVLLIAWIIAQVLKVNVPVIINVLLAPLITAGKGPVPQFLSFFIDRLLWFTGIHGSNVVASVMTPIWTQMITQNMEAYKAHANIIPNLFTAEWCNYFIRISVLPIAFLASISKVKRYKTIGRLTLPATIFNIAEPVMYGLPIVLNPILFIPWVVGFSALWIWTYVFTAIIPLLPPIVIQVAWTVPAPIAAYFGTGGSVVAMLFSCLNYVILGVIFYPFFKILERQELEREREGIELNEDN